jgi:hypothetical protein
LIDGFVDANDVVVVTGCIDRLADDWMRSTSAIRSRKKLGLAF